VCSPDCIICLEDGKKFKSLKRHLNVHYGLTPEANYAAQRSALVKSTGLGRKAAAKPVKKSAAKRKG
jgi:predicted transcriptional regulator